MRKPLEKLLNPTKLERYKIWRDRYTQMLADASPEKLKQYYDDYNLMGDEIETVHYIYYQLVTNEIFKRAKLPLTKYYEIKSEDINERDLEELEKTLNKIEGIS